MISLSEFSDDVQPCFNEDLEVEAADRAFAAGKQVVQSYCIHVYSRQWVRKQYAVANIAFKETAHMAVAVCPCGSHVVSM